MKIDAAMEQELARLEALSDVRLYQVLEAMDDDPAPEWVKNLIAKRINSIFNRRLGLEG